VKEIEHGLVLLRIAERPNIGLWNIDTGSALLDFLLVGEYVSDMAVSSDKESVVTSTNCGFFIWRTKDGFCIGRIEVSNYTIRSIKPLSGNRFVATTFSHSYIIEINTPSSVSSSENSSSELLFSFYHGDHNNEIIAARVLEDGSFLCGVNINVTRWCFSRECTLHDNITIYANQLHSIVQIDGKRFASLEVSSIYHSLNMFPFKTPNTDRVIPPQPSKMAVLQKDELTLRKPYWPHRRINNIDSFEESKL